MSSTPAKKMSRSTKLQINHLCQYMAQHPHFAAGDYKTPNGAAAMEREWLQLKAALDGLGPSRTVEQWKVCWRDQKRKARSEGGAIAHALNLTGNAADVPAISENSTLILGTIGVEMACGLGPAESPIGYTPPQTQPLDSVARPSSGVTTARSAMPGTAVSAGLSGITKVKRTRVRKSHPPDRFLQSQEELNRILKEGFNNLLGEIKKITDLLNTKNQ